MDVILTDISAWTVYASGAPLIPVPQAEAGRIIQGARASSAAASTVRDLAWWKSWEPFARALLGLPQGRPVPVHLMAHPMDMHGARHAVVAHRLPSQIPDGFLQKIAVNGGAGFLYLVSPAAYPLLRAREINEVLLAVLLAQLGSDFTARPDLQGVLVYRKRPLATPADIAAVAHTVERWRGLANLRAMLPYVAASAHSPMEIALQLSLCLPSRLGGCGLPLPEMNLPIEIPREIQILNDNRRIIKPDLAWMDHRLVVEYDSYQEHDQNSAQAQRDRNRRNIYDRLGLRVVTVDRESLRDDIKRNLMFETIAEALGEPFDWSSGMQIKRRELVWRLMHAQAAW